jgi:hypothetical protein
MLLFFADELDRRLNERMGSKAQTEISTLSNLYQQQKLLNNQNNLKINDLQKVSNVYLLLLFYLFLNTCFF